MPSINNSFETICAPATGSGIGAIAVIRVSGKDTYSIIDEVFSKKISVAKPYTIHLGEIKDDNKVIDEVLISVFKAPKSYTGEDTVEISCHGSEFIQKEILNLLIKKGARLANPGEFTLRAFLNGKLDLSQAEAIADLISSESKSSHEIAINQLKGGFSNEIKKLREQLINFASLIELELDFSEEDVEFANRDELVNLIQKIQIVISHLISSFAYGNAIKKGVPVAIIGKPNVGKSTLLNVLLNEERAIVSDIAGTTRDAIEDTFVFDGILFRFIDTAGIRETSDSIESKGIEKTYEKTRVAQSVILMIDATNSSAENIEAELTELQSKVSNYKDKNIIIAINKYDETNIDRSSLNHIPNLVFISAKQNENIDELKNLLLAPLKNSTQQMGNLTISNVRHFEALQHTQEALSRAVEGIKSETSSDLIAMDIRQALHFLGLITGQISTDDLLENIFSKFCIGK